ncbi:MAG: carboxypeptidase-like regulatory domain-containing protein [Bacteroidota bacterium]|nr:carboxypeptidase-like regulatory domain-containing protein [Bacteroidota bacterium]
MENWLKLFVTVWLIGSLLTNLNGQQKFTLSGTITDEKNGEFLIGATAYITSLKTAVSANDYGFYSITIPASDSFLVVFNYIGYETQIKKIYFDKSYTINIALSSKSSELDEVVIFGDRNDARNVEEAQMGVINIPISKVQSMPAIFGESDLVKVIQFCWRKFWK